METTNNNSRSPRTFVIGAVAGVVLATALGTAFLLGGQAGGSGNTAAGKELTQATATSHTAPQGTTGTTGATEPQQPTGDAPQNDDGNPPPPQSEDQEPVATETPAVAEEEDPTETPSATPTSTATPSGDCLYCLDGGFAIEPTPIDPCPLCNDFELAIPIDFVPEITNISTSFCFPTMAIFFDLSFADVVWFSFTSDGVTHESQHIDADTFPGYLTKDMGYLGWDVYFISNLRVHAKDDQGNNVWSDQIDIPEPDLAC